jgi:adenylosuccinate lyase
VVPQGLVSPLDYRYGRERMKRFFTEEARLRYILTVESALAHAHAEVGTIPKSHAKTIHRKAHDGSVKPSRVKRIEAAIRHDLMAVVKALAEQTGEPAGGSIHLGATSYDAIDTANALQFRDALDVLHEGLVALLSTLVERAREHKGTIMLGRTHAQAALPITFGYKLIVYAAELGRHLDRLREVRARALVGKMSGAVGSGAGFGRHGPRIERLVMERLGLGVEEAATQIVQRDRYVELFAWLANVATSVEKFATEVRNLQRTEIAEAAEGFDVAHQVGSSTMAQKKNPVTSEQVSGLARLVRANLTPTMENAVQWHERDLSNSAPERFLAPYTFVLTDWIVHKTEDVYRNLVVDAKRMRANLDATGGAVMAESLLLTLARKGMGRQEAHEHVRRLAHAAQEERTTLAEKARADPTISRMLSAAEVRRAFDPERYIGQCVRKVDVLAQRLLKRHARRS